MLFSMSYFGQNAWKTVQDNMESTARLTADNINQFFLQRKMALGVAADMPEVKTFLDGYNSGMDERALAAHRGNVTGLFKIMTQRQTMQAQGNLEGSYVRSSALVNREGVVIASDDAHSVGRTSPIGRDMRTVPAYEFYVSNVMSDPGFIGGKKFFVIAVPIYQDGIYQGFIQSSIDMFYFNMVSSQKFMHTGWTMVVDGVGTVAGDNVKDDAGRGIASLGDEAFEKDFYGDVRERMDTSADSGFLEYRENGAGKEGFYTAVSGTDWVILSTVPESELMNPLYRVMLWFGAVLLAFILALTSVSHVAAKRFLNPLRDMSSAFMRLKQKDYSVQLPDCYKGEFAEISTSFNTLVEKIREDTDELKVSEARYALIMEETNQVIFEWDILENHLYHTVHWTNKFGFSLSVENPGSELPDFTPVHPDDKSILTAFFWEARRGVQPKPVDVRMKTIESKYIWCTISIKVIFDENKQPFRTIGLIMDTDHQKKMIQNLESKSKMDLLTQMYNKVTTEKMIEEFLSTAPPEEHHGFIIIDIDNFKGVNDTLGHIYGDNVLKKISVQLKDLFRATDIVGRVGGDEFVILIKDLPDDKLLKAKLNDICEVFRGISTGENEEYRVSASVGAAVFPSDGSTFAELYQHADSALYRAKKMGKDGFSLFCDGQLKSS
jgi:diguanylate cyclase (GGDEF) domain